MQSGTEALRGKEAVKGIPVGKIQLLCTQDGVFLNGQFNEAGSPDRLLPERGYRNRQNQFAESPRIAYAASVKAKAVAVDTVVGRMETSGVRTMLVFLDSCRDNPFPEPSWPSWAARGKNWLS